MLHSISALRDFWIHATDGDLGAVSDFYLDERDWSIPCFAVDTGNWLPGRKVVVPVAAITHDAWDERHLYVSLSRDEIRHSPAAPGGRAIAHQIADAITHYLHMPAALSREREFDSPRAPSTPDADADVDDAALFEESRPLHPLHPVRDVLKLGACAIDGPIGPVDDLLCEDTTWRVRYAVIERPPPATPRETAVAANWLAGIDWMVGDLRLDLAREAVRAGPAYADHIDAEYERRLAAHYGRSI